MLKIRDLLDSCYEIFYEDIIIGTEAAKSEWLED